MRRPLLLTLLLITLPAASAQETRTVLLADSSKGRLAVVGDDGTLQWETQVGPLHDLHVLPDGNILYQTDMQTLVEADRETGEEVWRLDAGEVLPADYEGRFEVHAFQRLPDNTTMLAISGPGVVVDVNRAGQVVRDFPLTVSRPDPHRDTRLARRLPSGHTLVVHEGDGLVREYGPEGETVWEFEVPLTDYPSGKPRERADGHGPEAFGNQAFSAVRLPSGNTLIGTGNGHAVIEVTPEKEVVWSVGQDELPGVRLACCRSRRRACDPAPPVAWPTALRGRTHSASAGPHVRPALPPPASRA